MLYPFGPQHVLYAWIIARLPLFVKKREIYIRVNIRFFRKIVVFPAKMCYTPLNVSH